MLFRVLGRGTPSKRETGDICGINTLSLWLPFTATRYHVQTKLLNKLIKGFRTSGYFFLDLHIYDICKAAQDIPVSGPRGIVYNAMVSI